MELLRSIHIILTTPGVNFGLKSKGALGHATLAETVYGTLLGHMSTFQLITVGELEKALKPKNINLSQVIQSLLLLMGQEHVGPAQELLVIKQVRHKTHSLNRMLIEKSKGGAEISYLASAVTGGGAAVGRFAQLFLLSIHKGVKNHWTGQGCIEHNQ